MQFLGAFMFSVFQLGPSHRTWRQHSVTLLAGLAIMSGAAEATPVIWSAANGGNGHAYEYVAVNIGWIEAQSAALQRQFEGINGHLVNVTSAAENTFLGTLAPVGWLGGNDAAQEGQWLWADGSEAGQVFWLGGSDGQAVSYASWGDGEPNNLGNEDYLNRNSDGSWNDLPSWTTTAGYYVEYELPSSTTAVPEPGGLPLAGAASLAIWGLFRRRSTTLVNL
jgi:hypothetical protein